MCNNKSYNTWHHVSLCYLLFVLLRTSDPDPLSLTLFRKGPFFRKQQLVPKIDKELSLSKEGWRQQRLKLACGLPLCYASLHSLFCISFHTILWLQSQNSSGPSQVTGALQAWTRDLLVPQVPCNEIHRL